MTLTRYRSELLESPLGGKNMAAMEEHENGAWYHRREVDVWERPEKHTTGIKPEILCGAKEIPKSDALSLLYGRRPSEIFY